MEEHPGVTGGKPVYTFCGALADRELLTISQTMTATGLGKTSVFQLIKDGKLEGVKIMNARRVTRRSVEALIARGLEG